MTTALNSRQGALEPDAARANTLIQQALKGLAFGTVEITVHHGRIVQIERRERLRLPASAAGRAAAGAGSDRSTSQDLS
ncbi:MAG: YezD family protein [Pseudomonadota bacterium]|nr:YezD family protein [Pseudomonadota bacterium]